MKYPIATVFFGRSLGARPLLLGAVAALMLGCGESKPPTTPPMPAVAPAPPAAAPASAADITPQQAEAAATRKLDLEQVKRGAAINRANCAVCHGPNGEATPNWRNPGPDGKYLPPPLDGSAHAWHHSTETLKMMIREGSPPEAGNMPAWQGKLTDQQIDDVVVWITSLWPDDLYSIWLQEIERREPPAKN